MNFAIDDIYYGIYPSIISGIIGFLYYKIVDSKGNALVFKIYLQERNEEKNNKKEKILKIKSNKIIFDEKIIFGEIIDENQLLELLDKERTITLK